MVYQINYFTKKRMKVFSLKPNHFWLIFILVLAAILRFDQINQPFVDLIGWRESDNATIADNFYRGNWNILYPQISWNGPEPNYVGYEFQTLTYLAGLLYHFVGQHDWVGRSVSVMFGVWGIFALYQLVRHVWDEERALVSSAIMAFLPGSIFIDRSFISDPIMVSLVTTSFWFLVVYLQTGALRFLILASAIGILGFLTKISGLIIGIPMIYAMVTILEQKQKLRFKHFVPLIIASLVVLIPVFSYYLWAKYIYVNYPPHHIAAAGNWIWDHGFLKWLGEKYYLGKAVHLFDDWLWTKPIILLVLIGSFLKQPQQNSCDSFTLRNVSWLFHYWTLAMAIYYFVGAKELVDNPWNFHLVNPPAAALAGHAITSFAKVASRYIQFPALVIVLTAIVLAITSGFRYKALSHGFNPYYAQTQEGYELGVALSQITQPSDLVVAVAEEIGNPIGIYYSQRKGWVFPPVWSEAEWWDDIKDDGAAIESLEELRQKGAKWFGIAAHQKNKILQNNIELAQYIQQNCDLYRENSKWTIYQLPPPK